jgi:putative ubiquitin-RnfH superfamily antitoxin RatB of RatAB toxin-antitoxin module
MTREARMRATVVYCTPQHQHVLAVEVPAGTTLREAVLASGLLELEPGLLLRPLDVGVFNRPRASDAEVRPGDRIEVYRPLAVDPKEGRRLRAEVKRRRRAG